MDGKLLDNNSSHFLALDALGKGENPRMEEREQMRNYRFEHSSETQRTTLTKKRGAYKKAN